jgi:hypothetical protein
VLFSSKPPASGNFLNTKFIKVIGENSANSDYYFERILISINNKHPKEWTDIDSDLVKQKSFGLI